MAYNDPVGDVHEQSGIVSSNSGLSSEWSSLFGVTSIKHSDFRVDFIESIRIKVLGHENYGAYVDNNADVNAEFQQQTELSKAEYGKEHWKQYVDRRSFKTNQKTTEQYIMYYDREGATYTWNAPTETSGGYVNTRFADAVSVPVEFGDTIELEVQFGGKIGPYFENYRKYLSDNFSWVASQQSGKSVELIKLATSRGCASDKHAFQARYTFAEPYPDPNTSISITFSPRDKFNNHDNMSHDRKWMPCCHLKPKQVTGVKLTTSMKVNNTGPGPVCTSTDDVNVWIRHKITGLQTGRAGHTHQFNTNLNGDTWSQTDTRSDQAINNKQILFDGMTSDKLTTPKPGVSQSYTFDATAVVNGRIVDYDGTTIKNWQYQVTSDSDLDFNLARLPAEQNAYVTDVYTTSVSDIQAVVRKKKKRFDKIASDHLFSISPNFITGATVTPNTDVFIPSILVDADTGMPPDNQKAKTNADWKPLYLTFFSDHVTDTNNSIEYFEDGTWKQAYETNSDMISKIDNEEKSSARYEVRPNVTFWSYNRGSGPANKAWPQSGPWRITKHMTVGGVPKACSISSDTIHVVTVSKFDLPSWSQSPVLDHGFGLRQEPPRRLGVRRMYVDVEWQAADVHEVVVKDVLGDYTYRFEVEYLVEFYIKRFRNDILKKGTTTGIPFHQAITNQTKYDVPKNSMSVFTPGVEFFATVTPIYTGTDQFSGEMKQWRSGVGVTGIKTIIDCADPDLHDDAGKQYRNGDPVSLTTLRDRKTQTHEIMWHQPNRHVNVAACRDYESSAVTEYDYNSGPHNHQNTFHLIAGEYTFTQARVDAARRGGRLAVITSDKRRNKVNSAWVTGGKIKAWIGMQGSGDAVDGYMWLAGHHVWKERAVELLPVNDYVTKNHFAPADTTKHVRAQPSFPAAAGVGFASIGDSPDGTDRWSISGGEEKRGYILEIPTNSAGQNRCNTVLTHLVADIKCFVSREAQIEFSGVMSTGVPEKQFTTLNRNHTVGQFDQALDKFYFKTTADHALNKPASNDTSLNNQITITPHVLKDGETLVKYTTVVMMDDDDQAPGNRGDMSVERLEHDVVRLTIMDAGSDVLLGESHSDASVASSDQYHVKIYANILSV